MNSLQWQQVLAVCLPSLMQNLCTVALAWSLHLLLLDTHKRICVCAPFLMDLAFISTYRAASRNMVLHVAGRGACIIATMMSWVFAGRSSLCLPHLSDSVHG